MNTCHASNMSETELKVDYWKDQAENLYKYSEYLKGLIPDNVQVVDFFTWNMNRSKQ